ncbi:hypothetical protein NDU88_005456 [Pleurodeles waltl]|uniref:Uncharacterized protein n=1 Tax=Pleurodeles waltl TaxID=8319 RepID=A0AAV7UJP0_PLEWA|nr:hypothetical protein NDU88_005456 [Pleurodeles waltl]
MFMNHCHLRFPLDLSKVTVMLSYVGGNTGTCTPGNEEQSPRGTFRSPDVTSSNINPKREEKSENRRGRGVRSLVVVKEERTAALEKEEKTKGGRATEDRTEASASKTLCCESTAREAWTANKTSHVRSHRYVPVY